MLYKHRKLGVLKVMAVYQYIKNEIEKTIATMNQIIANNDLLNEVSQVAKVCADAIRQGNKILFMGNGGSAADSQHLAAELVSRLSYNRPAMAAIALTVDTSILTAIANDFHFSDIFSRQIEALGREGDVLFAISTSGSSANVLKASQVAKERGMKVIAFTGAKITELHSLADLSIAVPTTSTPKIQESHIMLGHIICGVIEDELYGVEYSPMKKCI
jgi:D-sedoheptulose 7-phosphate isomerase